jgi:2-hydroxychromene-2-carboxylate isomerase
MGELIVLADRLADRSRPTRRGGVAFFFDLACPFSYLASERVERELGEVDWIPTASLSTLTPHAIEAADREALTRRLPLVWPDCVPLGFPAAVRAAAYAAEMGRAARFALAAGRLAFCGGFDLDDPEILADAAAAAGLSPKACLAAAASPAWDAQPRATAEGLRRRGVSELPAIRVDHHWRYGRRAIAEAAALVQAGGAARSAG